MAKLKPERTTHLKTPRSSHNTTSNLLTPTSIPPLSQSLSSIHTNTGTPTAGPKQRGRSMGQRIYHSYPHLQPPLSIFSMSQILSSHIARKIRFHTNLPILLVSKQRLAYQL